MATQQKQREPEAALDPRKSMPTSAMPTACSRGASPWVRRIVAQFGHPRGSLGRLAGWIMAHRPSNLVRNRWAASLIAPGPGQRVLEIGCGPGIALEAIAASSPHAEIVGLDRSAVMLRQARSRIETAVAAGQVRLEEGDIETWDSSERFDAVLAVNVIQFLTNHVRTLEKIHTLLKPGGKVVLVYQPRTRGAGDEESHRAAGAVTRALESAGFRGVRVDTLPIKPAAVAVSARTA